MGADEVGVAIGGDDEHVHVGEFAGDELEQLQRRLVGPVQVVEHHDPGAFAALGTHELGVGVEEQELGGLGVRDRTRFGKPGHLAAQLGEQPHEFGIDDRCLRGGLRKSCVAPQARPTCSHGQ